jgi:hypothetical protein
MKLDELNCNNSLIGGLPHVSRRCKMYAYPYLQKELRSVKEKRESRVKVGSVFECVDRRQNYNIQLF